MTMRRLLPAAAAAVALIAPWQLLVEWREVPGYLLPRPVDVLAALAAEPRALLSHTAVTACEVVLGFALAATGAVAWAIAVVSMPPVRRAVLPLLLVAQSVPKEALAPLFVIWWGFSPWPKVAMAAGIAFFPMLVATVVGLERFTEEHRLLALSMGAGRLRTFASFRMWVALPSFLGGARVGATFAIVGAVIGEYLGSDSGIGHEILTASRRLDGAGMYANLVVLVLLSVALVRVVDVVERLLLPARQRNGVLP